MKPKRFGKGK